jgi:hypothetical protein
VEALHPNLARIAARYDEIIKLLNNKQLTPSQARTMIEKLAARDDLGVEWSLDPDTGKWRYRSKDGLLLPGNPPSWGLASATPKDMGSGSLDFDKNITLYEIDSSKGSGLINSTRETPTDSAPSKPYLLISIGVAVVITAILLVFVI